MKFKVVVHPEPEGGFWGEVPALPGCYSQGETVEQLLVNLREAALGYLEVLREEGRQPDEIIGRTRVMSGYRQMCRLLQQNGWVQTYSRQSPHLWKPGEIKIITVLIRQPKSQAWSGQSIARTPILPGSVFRIRVSGWLNLPRARSDVCDTAPRSRPDQPQLPPRPR